AFATMRGRRPGRSRSARSRSWPRRKASPDRRARAFPGLHGVAPRAPASLRFSAPHADTFCNACQQKVASMDWTNDSDFYERLQISANAEPETIHRVYRLLAPRFHPDNQETGDEGRFREITEAYQVLSDPEKRAQYDIVHERRRQQRWRLV